MIRFPIPSARNTYFLVVTNTPVNSLAPVLKGILAASAYASDVWLMVFNGTAVPSNGDVPIMTPLFLEANAANVSLQIPDGVVIGPDGIVIVASSTANTLTTDASATIYVSAFVEDWENNIPPGHSTEGDLTTSVSSLQVWSEAEGETARKRLKRVKIKNNVSEVRYAAIYAVDTPDADSRIVSWLKIPADEDVEWNFGYGGGLSPEQLNGDGTRHVGCTILCQETLTPGDEAAATDFNMEALYK